jgi:hypothetical protein
VQPEPIPHLTDRGNVPVAFALVLKLFLGEQRRKVRDMVFPACQDKALADFDEAVRCHSLMLPHLTALAIR